MRYGSVCSGIEAATAAWHPLGWKPSFFSEIEAFPRAVLQHHYPDVPLHSDFTTIKDGEYEPIDLLVGGTPCQSFSVAGLRKGMDDDRGNLALEYLRLAQRLRPTWLVWENVPGVLSSNGGRDFGSFLGGLGQLGYGFAYRVLDAQYFGVAQRRRRVFVVGHLGDWRRAAAVLFERESLSGNPAPRRESGKDPAGSVTHSFTSEGFDASEDGTGRGVPIIPACTGPLTRNCGEVCGTESVESNFVLPVLSSGQANAELTDNMAPALNCNRDGAPIAFTSKDHCGDAMEDCCPTLRSGGHDGSHANGGVPPAVDFAENQRGELRTSDVVTNITSGGGKAGQGYPATMHGMTVRRLTPQECERLQGFPEIVETEEIWVSATAQEHSQLHVAASAGHGFSTNLAGHEKPALVNVRINSERKAVEIRNAGMLIFSVSNAEELNRCPHLTLIVDSALALVGLSTTLAKRTRTGKAESQASMQSSIHRRSGSKPVVVFGQEIAELASGAEKAASEATTFITSPDGWTHQSCDTLMTILSCSVAHAIAGFIPAITPQKSFCIQIEAKRGYTMIPYRNKPAYKCPDGPRYKALGNSMAVPVMGWIGARIQMLEDMAEDKLVEIVVGMN